LRRSQARPRRGALSVEFRERSRPTTTPSLSDPAEPDAELTTPKERLADAVVEGNAAVAAELLRRIREREPVYMERVVLDLLTAMGYGGAKHYAERVPAKLVLIDAEQLGDLLVRYGVGVQTEQTYELKEVDEDYFEE
jgi:restriction endonuclease Mrr